MSTESLIQTVESRKQKLIDIQTQHLGDPKHRDIAICHHHLGNALSNIRDHVNAIEQYEMAIQLWNGIDDQASCQRQIAGGYNDLGTARRENGEFTKAIECYEIAIKSFQNVYPEDPNNKYFGIVYRNIGLTYYSMGELSKAQEKAEQALEIFSSLEDGSNAYSVRVLKSCILIQLGVKEVLSNNIDRAIEHFTAVNEKCFSDPVARINLIQAAAEYSYQNNALQALINCEDALIMLDPHMSHGNHLHNIACYYAANGEMDKASIFFNKAIGCSEVKASTHAEYAQFLIMHPEVTLAGNRTSVISFHLDQALSDKSSDSLLEYGDLEKSSICPVLQEALRYTDTQIKVKPQALSYYLLARYPEYINPSAKAEHLLPSFQNFCLSSLDSISFMLFVDACKFTFQVGSLRDHNKFIISAIDKISEKMTQQIPDERKILLPVIKALAEILEDSGKLAVSEHRYYDSAEIYLKLHALYSSIFNDTAQSKSAINKLSTVCLLSTNLGFYTNLKFLGATIDKDLLQCSGKDVQKVLKFDAEYAEHINALIQMQSLYIGDGLSSETDQAAGNITVAGDDANKTDV